MQLAWHLSLQKRVRYTVTLRGYIDVSTAYYIVINTLFLTCYEIATANLTELVKYLGVKIGYRLLQCFPHIHVPTCRAGEDVLSPSPVFATQLEENTITGEKLINNIH